MFIKRYTFVKKRESIPEINSQGKIIKERAGGIKLEYNVYVTDNIHMRIGKRDIYIPFRQYNAIKIVLIKPLKRQWHFKKYKLAKNFQGKKDSLYTNIWFILKNPKGNTDCYEDVVEISEDYREVRIKTLCNKQEHHKMIEYLNKGAQKFSIPFTQIFF